MTIVSEAVHENCVRGCTRQLCQRSHVTIVSEVAHENCQRLHMTIVRDYI
jgi:hypothetical protein